MPPLPSTTDASLPEWWASFTKSPWKSIEGDLFILIMLVAALAFLKWWFTYVER